MTKEPNSAKRRQWRNAVEWALIAMVVVAAPFVWQRWVCYADQPGYLVDAIQGDDLRGIKRYLDMGLSLNKHHLREGGYGGPLEGSECHPSIQALDELPLTRAVMHGRPELVKLMLHHGAKVDERTSHNMTALHYACMSSSRDTIVTTLVEAGADVNAVGGPCVTPIDLVEPARTEVVRGLLSRDARVNLGRLTPEELRSLQERPDRLPQSVPKPWRDGSRNKLADRQTTLDVLLRKAAERGARQTVVLLLELGANPNAGGSAGEKPILLTIAASSNGGGGPTDGLGRCVRLLLKRGAKARGVVDETGRTPLILASSAGDRAAVLELLKAGLNPNTKDDDGRTALTAASVGYRPEVVEVLLKAGADPNTKLPDGTTPLHLACKAHDYRTAELLLKAGADPNARTQKGTTPFGCLPLVEDLLR